MGGANRLRGMWWGFFFWSAYASFSVGVILYSSKNERKEKKKKLCLFATLVGMLFLSILLLYSSTAILGG